MSSIDKVIRKRAEKDVKKEEMELINHSIRIQIVPPISTRGLEDDLEKSKEERVRQREYEIAKKIVDEALDGPQLREYTLDI